MPHPKTNWLSFESRLYTWSLLFDPLLFFVILDQDITGVNLTVGRLLQSAFLISLFLRCSLRPHDVVLPNITKSVYKYFSIYLTLLLLSSVLGIFFFDSYILHYNYEEWNVTFIANVIRGPYFRPFIEIIILLYYFGYYIILPKYILNDNEKISYIFKTLIKIFKLMLFLGFLDLALQLTVGWYIPKHSTHTEFGYVGMRFHALLGEPRDAVPYLFFGLAMMYIWHSVVNDRKPDRTLLMIWFAALFMTQSLSGVIGLGITVIGLFFFYLFNSPRRLITIIPISIILTVVMIYLAEFSPRIMDYYYNISDGLEVLNSGGEMPMQAAFQISNFLPFWAMWLEFKEFNFIPLLIGSGVGSVSFVNNNLIRFFVEDATGGLFNPNAQITRVIYESGLIGTLAYVYALYYPVKRFLKIYPCYRAANFLLFALLMGASLAHRSTIIFIYSGLVFTLISNWTCNKVNNG
ncbi:hypothetical protein [Shewanella sp.]|uniref:hypothetical protein n=1 Tax=Shewanella sp. TaxID=50422 RepID=UPI0040476983